MIFGKKKKLTLNIDEELIRRAKFIADSQRRSLSDLVENYFLLISADDYRGRIRVSSELKSIKGVIRLKEFTDYKKIRADELEKMHSKP